MLSAGSPRIRDNEHKYTGAHRNALGGRRTAADRGGSRLRSALVVAEVAPSLALLVGAGLLIESFWKLRRAARTDPNRALRQSL